MADKKISALPAATTPLAGTEVLPIVQGGTTDQVSVANLTSGRFINMDSATVGSTSSAAYGSKLRVDGGVETFSAQFNIASGSSTPYEFVLRSSGAGFDFYVNAASKRSVRFLSSGDVSLTDNLVVGTAGKGIDFSANTHAPGMTSELLDWYEEGTWTGTLTAATPPTTPITKTGRYTRIGNQITIAIEFDNVDTSGAAGAMEVTGLPFAATAAGYGPVMKSGIGTDVIMAGVYGGLSKVIFSDAGTMSTTNIVAAAGVYLRFSATYYV